MSDRPQRNAILDANCNPGESIRRNRQAGTAPRNATHRRRAYLRFFACGLDLSHEAPDAPLPEEVAEGREPFLIVGAMAGG